MNNALLELAKILKDLCKDKEEYVCICKQNGIKEEHMFLNELYGGNNE